MITYTNYSDTVNSSLYDLINGEFKPVRIVFADKFDESDFQGNNQYIRIWQEDNSWISDSTDGETREYHYSVNYYIRDNTHIDRISLPKNWSNFGERLGQLLHNSRYYAPSGTYKWHSLIVEGSDLPEKVVDEDDEELNGVRSINKDVYITRSNFW